MAQAYPRACRAAGGKAGIAISDPFCVERHRTDFLMLIEHELDYVIGNEDEIMSLFETDDWEEALARTAAICPLVVCTRSGKGATIIQNGTRVDVPVEAITPVDATGAGDGFAAGFLFGLATGADIRTCGEMGCAIAGEVIRHMGPRADRNLLALLRDKGLV